MDSVMVTVVNEILRLSISILTHHMVCMETGLKILVSSAVVTLKPLWTEGKYEVQ